MDTEAANRLRVIARTLRNHANSLRSYWERRLRDSRPIEHDERDQVTGQHAKNCGMLLLEALELGGWDARSINAAYPQWSAFDDTVIIAPPDLLLPAHTFKSIYYYHRGIIEASGVAPSLDQLGFSYAIATDTMADMIDPDHHPYGHTMTSQEQDYLNRAIKECAYVCKELKVYFAIYSADKDTGEMNLNSSPEDIGNGCRWDGGLWGGRLPGSDTRLLAGFITGGSDKYLHGLSRVTDIANLLGSYLLINRPLPKHERPHTLANPLAKYLVEFLNRDWGTTIKSGWFIDAHTALELAYRHIAGEFIREQSRRKNSDSDEEGTPVMQPKRSATRRFTGTNAEYDARLAVLIKTSRDNNANNPADLVRDMVQLLNGAAKDTGSYDHIRTLVTVMDEGLQCLHKTTNTPVELLTKFSTCGSRLLKQFGIPLENRADICDWEQKVIAVFDELESLSEELRVLGLFPESSSPVVNPSTGGSEIVKNKVPYTLLDRYPADVDGHIRFIEFCLREIVEHADAVKRRMQNQYSHETLESMVRGIKWQEAQQRLTAIVETGLTSTDAVRLILRRTLTVDTVETIAELLTPAVKTLRDEWENNRHVTGLIGGEQSSIAAGKEVETPHRSNLPAVVSMPVAAEIPACSLSAPLNELRSGLIEFREAIKHNTSADPFRFCGDLLRRLSASTKQHSTIGPFVFIEELICKQEVDVNEIIRRRLEIYAPSGELLASHEEYGEFQFFGDTEWQGERLLSAARIACDRWLAAFNAGAFELADRNGAMMVEEKSTIRKKRSTNKGDARAKLIAALSEHHNYADPDNLVCEYIGSNELAKKAGVSPSTASDFFRDKFQGHEQYRTKCIGKGTLLAALKMLNNDFAPFHLYGGKPAVEPTMDEVERDLDVT